MYRYEEQNNYSMDSQNNFDPNGSFFVSLIKTHSGQKYPAAVRCDAIISVFLYYLVFSIFTRTAWTATRQR